MVRGTERDWFIFLPTFFLLRQYGNKEEQSKLQHKFAQLKGRRGYETLALRLAARVIVRGPVPFEQVGCPYAVHDWPNQPPHTHPGGPDEKPCS